MATNSIGPGRENMAVTLNAGEPRLLGWYAAQMDRSRNELVRDVLRELLRQAQEAAREAKRSLPVVALMGLLSLTFFGFGDDVARRARRPGRRLGDVAFVATLEGGEG